MTNSFEQHGINHLSASSCTAFVTSRAMWCLERLLKWDSPKTAPMHAGTAGEDGIVHGLKNLDAAPTECVDQAMKRFRDLMVLTKAERREKYEKVLPYFVQHGLQELRPYGTPSPVQGKIEKQMDGVAVPFVGYFDLYWADAGVLTDIKTTLKMPSAIKVNHARQVALYKSTISDNLDARVTYVTGNGAKTYALENHREHVEALHKIALTMQRFLGLSKDKHELCALVCPDYEHFVWSSDAARAAGREVWGF